MTGPALQQPLGLQRGSQPFLGFQPLQPITSDNTSCPGSPKKSARYWRTLAPERPITSRPPPSLSKRPGEVRQIYSPIGQELLGRESQIKKEGWKPGFLGGAERNEWLGKVDWEARFGSRGQESAERTEPCTLRVTWLNERWNVLSGHAKWCMYLAKITGSLQIFP